MQKSAAKVKQIAVVLEISTQRRLSIATNAWMVRSFSRLLADSLLLIGRLLFSLVDPWRARFVGKPKTYRPSTVVVHVAIVVARWILK
jgi:hypothetical protein